jgi:hypothetical protein
MFVKIFLKEWRENILIFTLALLMMAVMIVLNLSGRQEMTLHFSGMFLLLFLPFAALLIGSGGFYSEYKDNAWIYLFSRPIRKELIWVVKYASQLSILIVVFIIFFYVRRFLPGLEKIFQDIDYSNEYSELFSVSAYTLMPLMAFTLSFSLSSLYEKQFVIFFGAILIGAGLMFVSRQYTYFLWERGFYLKDEGIFSLFFMLSFVFASILTFVKSDFSQIKKKIFRFLTYLLILIVISILISTVWATRGEIIFPRRDLSVWNTQKYLGSLYLQDFRQGILRFDPEAEKIERLNKDSRGSNEPFSLREGRIAYLEIHSRMQWEYDLWIMNDDGSDARPLVETSAEGSPFYKKRIGSFILSSDAEKVAFTTTFRYSEGKGKKDTWIHTLWWMKTDGTGRKSLNLDVPKGKEAQVIVWPRAEESLVLMIGERIISREKAQIIKVDLENGTSQLLADNVIAPYVWHPSPDQNYLTLKIRNYEENKDTLVLLNLKTLDTTELFSAEFLKMWAGKWSPDGSRIAFSRDRELWIFYVEEDRLEKISQRNYEYEIGFDWTSDGKKFILIAPIDGENHLVVMDENFEEIKKIKIPVRFESALLVWGLENQALLKGTGKGALWRVDLDTEDWKKVH